MVNANQVVAVHGAALGCLAFNFFRANAQWKHEQCPIECFEWVALQPNKAVWETLSTVGSKREGNEIASQFGLDGWYNEGSFPRKSEKAALIAQLCTEYTPVVVAKTKVRNYPTKGEGWQLL